MRKQNVLNLRKHLFENSLFCFLEDALWPSCFMPPYFLLLFSISCRENKKEHEWLRLGENYPHCWSFCTFDGCVRVKYPRCFPSLSPAETRETHVLSWLPNHQTTPACLHLLMAAPWLETGTPYEMPAEADGVSQLCKWPGSIPRTGRGAGRRAGWWIALQGAVVFGKVLWKHRCRWCRERTSADGLTLSVGSRHVGCDCLHSHVRGHFLLTARSFTPGAQLARGTYASWTSKARAIQKHKTLRVRPNPPSQVVFFLSSEKTEEAIH